ncbi:MAG: hypothetical protein AAFV07_05300, partial [Bacteroidota bacterium]
MNQTGWVSLVSMLLLMSCLPGSAPAQKNEAAFHQMLTETYQETVPLLRPDPQNPIDLTSFQILDTREMPEFQ